MIETPSDIAEEIADRLGIHGACPTDEGGSEIPHDGLDCRCCFVSGLKSRMRGAVHIKDRLRTQPTEGACDA